MSIIRFAAIAALTLFCAMPGRASTVQPAVPKIESFTGEIQIKVGDKVYSIIPGGKLPDIHEGDEVTIVSGDAVFSINGSTIKGSAGASFKYSSDATGAVTVSAIAGSLTIVKGKETSTVNAGNSSVIAKAKEEVTPKKTETVIVKKDDKDKQEPVVIPLIVNTVQKDETIEKDENVLTVVSPSAP